MGIKSSFLYFLTPLLFVSMAMASSESVRRGNLQQTKFIKCLEDTSGNEQACLRKLGIQAWYPGGDADCEAVIKRIDTVLAVGGLPRWPDFFKNERCARLGMPHHAEAVASSAQDYNDRSYLDCYNVDYDYEVCDDIYGRHRRHRPSEEDCAAIADTISEIVKRPGWEGSFMNERCWRLGLPHYEAD